MWALYSLLALLGFVVLLVLLFLFIPVVGRITYDGELTARIRVLGIPFTLSQNGRRNRKRRSPKAKKQNATSKRWKNPQNGVRYALCSRRMAWDLP